MSRQFSELEVLNEMFYRGLLEKGSLLEEHYYWLRSGFDGEMEMLKRLREKLFSQPNIIYDLTIELNGITQVDFLVLWRNYWWVIEVKNYAGIFELRNNECFLRGKELRSDQLAAMRKRMRIIRQVAQRISSKIKVAGNFVLIHQDGELLSKIDEEFEVVTSNQVSRIIFEHGQNQILYSDHEFSEIKQVLNRYISDYPVDLPLISSDQWEKCKKGIRCQLCNSYNFTSRKKQLICNDCGNKIYKYQAAIELYCQLSTLAHAQNELLTIKNIALLSNNLISEETIRRALLNNVKDIYIPHRSYLKNIKMTYSRFSKIMEDN